MVTLITDLSEPDEEELTDDMRVLMQAMADTQSQPIEGIARMGYTPFSMPLITHVEGNLWQGGCPVGKLPDQFKHVFDLYNYEKYDVGPNTKRVVYELTDSRDLASKKVLYKIANEINKACQDGPTLVHCQAGLNRSGLVTALALYLRGGRTIKECIALLRKKRSSAVLCNQSFEEWLWNQQK